jgi:alpha-tubulin suppressor-like RCC1 family protein
MLISWGSNDHGQLGLGDYKPRLSPTLVREFSYIESISCGLNNTTLLMSLLLMFF